LKTLALTVLAALLLGAADPSAVDEGSELATQRKVHGVITAVTPDHFTIESTQTAVTGRIDPARTKVTVNGHPGRLADLKISDHAKGELCLDDVWIAIDTH
jgi:hypothetical protein